jgi:hypothetical protein
MGMEEGNSFDQNRDLAIILALSSGTLSFFFYLETIWSTLSEKNIGKILKHTAQSTFIVCDGIRLTLVLSFTE